MSSKPGAEATIDATTEFARFEQLVLDAEGPVAYFNDEAGADAVEAIYEAVLTGNVTVAISQANWAEVYYNCVRDSSESVARKYLRTLRQYGVTVVRVDAPLAVGRWKVKYNPALGDCYALAAAGQRNCPLVIGSDDDYDPVTDLELLRFR